MFFRAAVLSLLGCMILLHVESEVRHAHDAAAAPSVTLVAPPPAQAFPAPLWVQPPEPPSPAEPPAMASLVAPETRLIDVRGSEIDHALAGDWQRAARIVPHLSDGRRDGLKLYAVRPGGLFDLLGLRNGDLLVAVDDLPVDRAETALALPGRAAEAGWVDLSVERHGLPVRIVVLIHR